MIAKNRFDDARKALQWLRGCVPAEDVETEFAGMTTFIAQVNACLACQRDKKLSNGKCTHRVGYLARCKELMRTNALRPLGLLWFCMIIGQSSGNAAIRPFLVQIFQTFRIPMDPNWGSVSSFDLPCCNVIFCIQYFYFKVLMGFVDIATNLFLVVVIPIIGKRFTMLIGLSGVVVFCFGVATNAFFYLDFNTSSFDLKSRPGTLSDLNPYALPLFVCLGISASMSASIPWMMNSEVYPFRYYIL